MSTNKARLLAVLVENHPGVLQRVASMIRRRGFNIDSLSVGVTDDPAVSRMTITVHVGKQQATQATKQIAKLIDVIEVDDITEDRVVAHEMLLIKLRAPSHGRRELLDVIDIFRGRVVDVADHSLIAEVTGSEEKIANFIDVVRPFGIRELARSGSVALLRGDEVRLQLVDNAPGDDDDRPAPRAAGSAGDMTGVV
jgi:acetolactate synthase-1/3 small subunit